MGRPRGSKKPKEPCIGHNGGPLTVERKRQLSGYITEIERWNAEIKTIRGDVKVIFDSAKDAGFDVKAMRRVLKDRQKTKDEREAFEMIVETYAHALGMLADLPLGKAAIERDLGTKADKILAKAVEDGKLEQAGEREFKAGPNFPHPSMP